jgi:hypothetical protein
MAAAGEGCVEVEHILSMTPACIKQQKPDSVIPRLESGTRYDDQ